MTAIQKKLAYLKACGLDFIDIAEKLKISRVTLTNWNRDKTRPHLVYQKALDDLYNTEKAKRGEQDGKDK